MESKKLEKPRKNGAFSTRQAVTKPDEETGGVFPTMVPLRKPILQGDSGIHVFLIPSPTRDGTGWDGDRDERGIQSCQNDRRTLSRVYFCASASSKATVT